jgi:hypothetical protein
MLSVVAFIRWKKKRALECCMTKRIQTVPKSLYIHLSPSRLQGKAEQSKRRNTAQPNRFMAQAQAGRQAGSTQPPCAGSAVPASASFARRPYSSIDATHETFLNSDIWAEDQRQWRILGVGVFISCQVSALFCGS